MGPLKKLFYNETIDSYTAYTVQWQYLTVFLQKKLSNYCSVFLCPKNGKILKTDIFFKKYSYRKQFLRLLY